MTGFETNQAPCAEEFRRLRAWLLLLFVGSGFVALIYQIVWLQMLQLVIGLTTVSLGLLLGAFMGGLCLGSLLLPRFAFTGVHPLRVYALLEIGVGVFGVALLFGLPWLEQLYARIGGAGPGGMLLRGMVAAVCLLPPTVLMGATLPALARWIKASPAGVSWLGWLYGGNILGAVFGCLFAGFYLLRFHDVAVATYVAAAGNGVLALAALALGRRGPAGQEMRPGSVGADSIGSTSASTAPTGPAEPAHWPVYVVTALSGMAALGAEVIWTRQLSLVFGGTVYTFSIILAVFLAGLGIGSVAGAWLARSAARADFMLGLCQWLLAAAIAWTAYTICHSLPYWPVDPGLSRSHWIYFQMDFARCAWAVLPAAMLWGASFPLALAAAARPGQDPARLVGDIYAANTIGAIVGALGFSMAVIPVYGTQWAQRLLIAISAAAALLLFATRARRAPGQFSARPFRARATIQFKHAVLALLVTGVCALLALSVSPLPWGVAACGRYLATYGNRLAPDIREEKDVPKSGGPPDVYPLFVGEGLDGTIAVSLWTSGVRNFHSAGKVQASTELRDMRLQRLLGHISALGHHKPESVLVVACGAGVTAGAIATHPEVRRIVICDIESLVPKVVAPMFARENHGVITDPRTQVVHDDGRHFLRTTREKFDIITSDPIDPWVKGCAALNTVEYFEMCKSRLNPGGVMTLWIPLYESSTDAVKSSIATFFKVFPHGIIWSNDGYGGGYDVVLFGQVEPPKIHVDQLQARLDREDHARVKRSLSDVGFLNAGNLLASYAGHAPSLREWLRDAQVNTDRNLRLQYLAGLGFNQQQGPRILGEITRHYRFPDELFTGSPPRLTALKFALNRRSRPGAAD